MGKIHELSVLALSSVWFAGATPEFSVLLQTSAATPPHLSVKMAYRSPKTGRGGRASQKKLASEAYCATIGALHERVSPIVL